MHTIHRIATVAVALAMLLASAALAVAEPALWVVKGPHATVYLFGTVHILPKNIAWRAPKIDSAMAKSNELWLEIPNADDAAAMQPLAKEFGLDAAHPLSTKLSKEQLAHLDAVARQAGIPAGEAALEPFRPWLAAVSLSMAPLIQAGWDPASGVELTLKPEFVKANKPIRGLETIEQQLHFFADLPEKTEVAYLDTSLDDFDAGVARFQKVVDAWAAGDVTTIDQLLDRELREKYPELYKTLIVKRNQAWTSRISEMLKGEGTFFIAVGAGHLAGPDSVPALLTAAGFTVERQ